MTLNGTPRVGYYIVELLNPDGSTRGRYGPYQLSFIREFLGGITGRLDRAQIEHALAITQSHPGQPYDLTDIRERNGLEYIYWSVRLTWHWRRF